MAQLKKYGLFYYCNIASPYIIEGNIIKYIDYDLDLRIFPDGTFKVLDKNEYRYHKITMRYSEEIDIIVQDSLNKLIENKSINAFPFKKEVIEHYYKIYKDITDNNS